MSEPSNQLWEEATRLHQCGQFAEAEARYDALLTQNHDNAGLLGTMGTLYLQTERLGLAISLLERSASKKPQGDVLCNLGIAYKQSGQHDKCREAFKRALKFDPSSETLGNYAALHINIGQPDVAIDYATRAIKLDPDNGMAHWNLAIGQLEKGMWETAWDEHEWGFKSKPAMRIDRGKDTAIPQWDGTPGKRLWIYGEQGLGDEIMFASILPDVLRTNEVVLECHQRLVTIFQKAFPGVTVYGTREEKVIDWLDNERIDARVSIGSLGKFYRRSKESFPGKPYLKAESAPKGRKFRVGISWTGGLKPGRIATRAVPLPRWASILNNDCEFVSLQYTDCAAELEAMRREGYAISEHAEVKAHDYYETAKLVQSCDLVISVCTSVIHLAGALGVPCWVMVPNKPAWRYGVTGRMPWYRSVRLYRQPEGDSDAWTPVIQRVGFDLSELISEQRMAA